MRPDDSDAVVALVVAVGMFAPEESAQVRDLLDAYGAGPAEGHTSVIDEQDGRVVGVAYSQPRGPADRASDLTMIAVLTRLQGSGRGGALLGHIEDDLRERGRRLLVVDTSGTAQYERARAFYRTCGYTEEARVRDYWADGDDLVIFTKRLDRLRRG